MLIKKKKHTHNKNHNYNNSIPIIQSSVIITRKRGYDVRLKKKKKPVLIIFRCLLSEIIIKYEKYFKIQNVNIIYDK